MAKSEKVKTFLGQLGAPNCNINILSIIGPYKLQLPTDDDINVVSFSSNQNAYTYTRMPMPTLERIPNLRRLYLHQNAYIGREMVCSAMGFP